MRENVASKLHCDISQINIKATRGEKLGFVGRQEGMVAQAVVLLRKKRSIEMAKVRTRFAPSPTGYMHIGNLRTALYEYLIAKHDHGDFILRIEDTDQEREVEGAVDMIYKVMDQTGLGYDEGPNKPGEVGPYVQSERLAIYKEYADKLVELGELIIVSVMKKQSIKQKKNLIMKN